MVLCCFNCFDSCPGIRWVKVIWWSLIFCVGLAGTIFLVTVMEPTKEECTTRHYECEYQETFACGWCACDNTTVTEAACAICTECSGLDDSCFEGNRAGLIVGAVICGLLALGALLYACRHCRKRHVSG